MNDNLSAKAEHAVSVSGAARFTPGPWKIRQGSIVDSSNTLIQVCGVSMPCGYVPPKHVGYANARLIAAAPDLLEALKEMVAAMGACTCHEGYKGRKLTDPDCMYCGNQPEIKVANAAIAKAEIAIAEE